MQHGPESLRAEVDAIETEIAEAQQQVGIFETRERDAVERHDKAALEGAWADHDACIDRIRALELRREQVARDMLRQVELEVDRWRMKSELQVQRWGEEQAEAVQRLLAHVNEVASMLDSLDERSRDRSEERIRLMAEFEAVRPSGFAREVPQPEIAWNVPGPDLSELANLLSELAERCRVATGPGLS